jgi:hypothetical protein
MCGRSVATFYARRIANVWGISMSSLKDDPLFNVIQSGIKEDIRAVLAIRRFRAAAMLIYAGMDAMAALSRPVGQDDVKGEDFIVWADRYMRFPCREQLSGLDFYGARCAMLHTYSSESRISRQGRCRHVGYVDQAVPEVRYAPFIDPDLVIISTLGLGTAFFSAIDRFLIDALSNPERKPLVVSRMEKMIHHYPYNAVSEDDA